MNKNELKYGKETIGPSDKFKYKATKPNYSVWIENGVYYQAPTIDPKKFGPHDYERREPYQFGINNCVCGCYMGSSSSSGPCDPFENCPENPIN